VYLADEERVYETVNIHFQGYHIEHHKFMGQDGIDTDLPTRFELFVLNNVLGKVFFAYVSVYFGVVFLLTPFSEHFKSYSMLSDLLLFALNVLRVGIFSTSPFKSFSTMHS